MRFQLNISCATQCQRASVSPGLSVLAPPHDTIILSAHYSWPPSSANLLSGGDYDGDDAVVTAQKPYVDGVPESHHRQCQCQNMIHTRQQQSIASNRGRTMHTREAACFVSNYFCFLPQVLHGFGPRPKAASAHLQSNTPGNLGSRVAIRVRGMGPCYYPSAEPSA